MTISYDPQTALLVVDVQNDFADPSGALHVPEGQLVIEAINQEIKRASSAGAFVVYTQDWHPNTTPHFERDGGLWPVHCVGETWGADFHPELDVVGPSVLKGTGTEDGYSGFASRDVGTGAASTTGLADLLQDHDIERVVVVGLALDYCVKATALDARKAGLEATVLSDATRPVDLEPGDGQRAIEELEAAGVRVA